MDQLNPKSHAIWKGELIRRYACIDPKPPTPASSPIRKNILLEINQLPAGHPGTSATLRKTRSGKGTPLPIQSGANRMFTTEDFDALRPYADNFDAAPPHLIRKLDAHIANLNNSVQEELGATQPTLPPVFAERNRKNAQKSTGPKTAAGKAASSRNRLAHGLCAQSLLIAGEAETDFENLRQSVVAAYQPASAEETLLTDQVAQALWRFNRAQRIESTYLLFGQTESQQILAARGINRKSISDVTELQGDSLTTGLFMRDDSYQQLERIQRYLTTAERSYQRAVKLLQHTQEKRRKLPQPAAPVAAQPEIEPAPEPLKVAAAGSSMVFNAEAASVPIAPLESIRPRQSASSPNQTGPG